MERETNMHYKHACKVRATVHPISGQVEVKHMGDVILTTSIFLEERYKGHEYEATWYACQKKVEMYFPFGIINLPI